MFTRSNLKLLLRIVGALWRSRILRLSPGEFASILGAWRRCRSSFAFLSEMAAIRAPHRVAFHDEWGPTTYAEFHRQSLALATVLQERFGVGARSQVAVICHNHRGFALAMVATTRLGADILPLGTDLPRPVLEAILKRQDISLILHDREVAGNLPESIQGFEIDIDIEPVAGVELEGVRRAGELIVLTSGTTGLSKGIRRRPTIGQLLPLVTGLLESIPIQMHRPIVLAIPLHHGYGIATFAMSLALASPLYLARRFEIAPLLLQVVEPDPPFLVTVPTLLRRWLRSPERQPNPKLAAVITGSAPLEASLCQELLEVLGPVLLNLYGSSEAGLIALALPQTLQEAPGSVGEPMPGNSVRLLDQSGAEVALGETGRISVRGPFVLQPAADGWRETGDLGRRDERGNLYVCGRVDSMLVSGGENVYPHELEEVLASHESVAEVAVLVVDDADFGQRMVAVVVARSRAELDGASLKQWLSERVERFKIPRSIHVVTAIPRNPLGKVDRLALLRMLSPESQT